MNRLCTESVALDTNVFIHLFNPQNNVDDHIDTLLGNLFADGLGLLVDEAGHIAREYDEKLSPRVQRASDDGPKIALLRYWMSPDRRRTVAVDKRGALWREIESVIRESREVEDRSFVCVAFTRSKPFVTNDIVHIINGPNKDFRGTNKQTRRQRLHKIARKMGLVGDLCTTAEASPRSGSANVEE